MAKSRWMDGFVFARETEANRPFARNHSPRAAATAMVNEAASRALYDALRAKAKADGVTIGSVQKACGAGVSTFQKMRAGRPVRRAVVLKVCTYLGTSLPALLTKSQPKEN